MKVAIGPATIVGYLVSAVSAAASAWAAAEHELAGHGKWLAILSVVSALVTGLGRQLQAAFTPEHPPRPQSAVKPDGAAPAPPPQGI